MPSRSRPGELGLEQLWLVLRGGTGLEALDERRGRQVAGVHGTRCGWPPGGTRDEVLMPLLLTAGPAAAPAGPPAAR